MNKVSRKCGTMWRDLIYIWKVYLNVMKRMNPSWKIPSGYYPGKFPQPSKAGQYSSPGNTENTTKIFHKKSNPKEHNRQIHQGWNKGENAKGSQRERSGSTQNFISSQTKLHKWRTNKILYEQAIADRFHHHQACLRRAPKRSTKHRKEQPVPATPKMYQMVKSIDTMKKLHQLMGKTAS